MNSLGEPCHLVDPNLGLRYYVNNILKELLKLGDEIPDVYYTGCTLFPFNIPCSAAGPTNAF